MNERQFYVYILASKRNGTLYTGMTNDIGRRMKEHKEGKGSIFTKKYKVNKLVFVDSSKYVDSTIEQEKRIKHMNRKEKLALIEENNLLWEDLSKLIL